MCSPHFPLSLTGACFFFIIKGGGGLLTVFACIHTQRRGTLHIMRWVNAAGTQNTRLYKATIW